MAVEDEPEVRTYTVAALKAYGYRVLTAEDAESALRLVERAGNGIDLVLTDLVMPRMSGRDLAARLAQLRPSLKVLYMSGYSSDIVVRHGMLEDGIVLVEKPFSPEQLAQKVREVLGLPKSSRKVLALADGEGGSLVRELLLGWGYDLIEAKAHAEACELIQNTEPVDLIIAELSSQEQIAIDTLRALREAVPGVPVIAVLDASGGHFLEMERRIGADAAIAKPVSAEFLQRTVREVLTRHQTA